MNALDRSSYGRAISANSHPPERVFEAFAKPELLARWWGPDGFTNTFEVFEFRVGGRWKFVLRGPNGSHHPNESVFLELKAPSAVVIHHVSPPRYVLRMTLATCADGTAIEWAQEFEDSAVADRTMRTPLCAHGSESGAPASYGCAAVSSSIRARRAVGTTGPRPGNCRRPRSRSSEHPGALARQVAERRGGPGGQGNYELPETEEREWPRARYYALESAREPGPCHA